MTGHEGFIARKRDIDPRRHVIVRYRIQTQGNFLDAAVALSKEQSFSAFEHPAQEKRMIRAYGAKVIVDSVKAVATERTPATPLFIDASRSRPFITRDIDLAFPAELFGSSLTALLSMVIGEVHNIARFSGIKVLDITLPRSWHRVYAGPVFGIEGIRDILGKRRGPVLISPVKPCVGLTPDQFAARVRACLMGGFDGVKDDELLLDPPYNRFKERVRATMRVVREVEKMTGKKKIYFTNVGGDRKSLDDMVRFALSEKVGGIMFSPLINGFDIIDQYRGTVPIIAHNNLSYGFARHPLLGVSFALYAKLQRLVGADMIICPAPDRSFYVMDMDTHRQNVDACIEKNGLKRGLAGLSGSQTPETLYDHAKFLGHDDFAICPGGAVYEHPLGIEAGARSFVEAVEAVTKKKKLSAYANSHEALRVSIERFKKSSQFER